MTDHQTIAHRWAQDRDAKLKGYAMFCEEGRIYSHGRHFIIARFADTKERRGKPARRVVLFNANTYSVSTSKHQSYTRRAIPSRYEVFSVPDLDRWDYTTPAEGRAVLDWHVAQAVELYAKAKRARVNGPWLVSRANGHLTEAERFAEAFGHKWKRPASLDAAVEAATKKAATQAKAAAKAAKERAKRQAEERQRQQERDAFAFEAWRNGEPVQCPRSFYSRDDGSAYVTRTRYADGVEELRTSQGAAVPWEHAVKAFRFIRLCVERGEAWERNGRTVRVGHYTLDRIEAGGDMRAGCHRFAWDEMRALAEREGVFTLAPSDDAVEGGH